jgi:serine/threonine protein kinase
MTSVSLFSEKPPRSLSEFEFLQDPKDKNSRLGVGSFATVKLAREKKTGRLLALKIVNLENSKNKASDLHNLRTEVIVHKKTDHPNIIRYHGYMQEGTCVYMALDYAEKGNLYSYIHKKKTPLTPQEIFRFFYQSCLAIQHVHEHDVMHRDIKPENLLLDKDLNIKLCDFGWAAERIHDKRTTFCGTYEYMAPEIIYKRPYDYRIDVWSLGILLYELLHKEAPYKGRSLNEIHASLAKGPIVYGPHVDMQAKDLMQRILKPNPSDRPSISQILAHPWVRKHTDIRENAPSSIYSKLENSKENVRVVTQENSERMKADLEHYYSKTRKPSNLYSSTSSQSEVIRRRPFDDQSAEQTSRSQIKSSCSLAKTLVDLDVEERKHKITPIDTTKMPLVSHKKSFVSPTSLTALDSVVGEIQTSSNLSTAAGSLTKIPSVVSPVSINAVSGGFGSKNIRGSPPLLGVQSSNNLDISGTTHTLDTSQSVTSHKKVRTLTNLHSLMNVRPIDTFNGVPQTTQNLGVSSTRFQIGGAGARRMLFDSHSQSHLVNRAKPNLVSQGYPSITSPQNTDLGALISPSGGPKRRVMSTKFKAEWIKNTENNNMQVKQFGEQNQNKQDDNKGITFSKFSKGSADSKAKFLVKPEHLNAMRVLRPLMKEKKINKENSAVDALASAKSMSVLDKFYSPKELHFRVPV